MKRLMLTESRRKTVKVRELVELVNRRNRESTCPAHVRQGWNSLLEAILHATGNYAGFGYLSADKVPDGHLPGMILDEKRPANNRFPDETRRSYIFSRRLS